MKKFLSIFLSAMMTVSVFTASGATAAAYETDTAESQAQTEQIGSGDSVYGNFEYTVSYNNEVTITKYTGSDTEVAIPSEIEGKLVTSIGASAFKNCSSLTSVTIPDSVTSIGYSAFSNCSSLASVTIPSSVRYIGSDAFHFCSSLTSVTIPESVTSIEELAFFGCSSLTNIDVDTNNKDYRSIDGVLFKKNKTNLISYPQGKVNTSYKIPDSVTSIGRYAFRYCSSLTSVTIPDSVTRIGYYAFDGCDSLKDVYYSGTEEQWQQIEIGNANSALDNANKHFKNTYGDFEYAAENADEVTIIKYKGSDTDVVVPSTIDGKPVTSIGKYAFSSCSSVTSVTIPDSVTSIGDEAFRGCRSLTSVTIPDSVTSIGNAAFYGCSSLTSVTIPDSVTSIGDEAFCGCSSLTSVTIPDGVTKIGKNAFWRCNSLTSVTIPDSVTSIGNAAFYGCSSLTSVTIPYSVTSIGNAAFDGCSSLTNIDVDANNANYISTDGVLFNKNKTKIICYPAGNKNTSYTIPDSVTSIGSHAFSHCSLTSVTIPDSVTSIEIYAFYDCSRLTSVTIPDSVTSIGDYVFGGCSSLTSVTIPDSVTSIGQNAFYGCSSLTSVTIPDSVTSIRNSAFHYCSRLTSVTIPDSVTSIEWGVFYGCSSLTSVTIPESVTRIEGYVFWDCSRLTSVTIPNSVKSIGNRAFGYMYNSIKIDGFTIYGYKGSEAEAYANENGFIFAALEKEVENVTLNKTTITIGVGQSYTLKAATDPEDAETTFTWKSSKKDIATVTSKGKVTGKAVGRATITVKTANGKTATCKVEVKPAPESVAISKTSIKIGVKQKYTLTATLTPSNTATYCTWSSDNTAVATVNSGGVVTGKKTGTAVITVKTSNGKTATCKVTVKKAPIAIALDKTELYLNVDETYTFTKLVPENSAAEYTWSSSDADVAEVSSAGKVTAKKTGTAIITLSSHNGKTAACTVTVN